MKDGFKIVDVDAHLMEPDWVFEKFIDEKYKSQAPKMGVAAESGRRTFLVEGEPFTREKGKYPMAAPAFFKAVRKAMERFERASKLRLQSRQPFAGHGRAGCRRAGGISYCRRADAGARVPGHQAACRMLPRLQRLGDRLLLERYQTPARVSDLTDAGCRGSHQRGESRGEKRRGEFLHQAEPGRRPHAFQ